MLIHIYKHTYKYTCLLHTYTTEIHIPHIYTCHVYIQKLNKSTSKTPKAHMNTHLPTYSSISSINTCVCMHIYTYTFHIYTTYKHEYDINSSYTTYMYHTDTSQICIHYKKWYRGTHNAHTTYTENIHSHYTYHAQYAYSHAWHSTSHIPLN